MRNLYEVLEIEINSTNDEIKKAYRRLAKKYHPDLNSDDENSIEKFREVQFAYEILIDEKKRKQYDMYGEAGINDSTNSNGFGDIFSDIFSDIFGFSNTDNSHTNSPRRGMDLEYHLKISFEEAIFGSKKKIKIKRLKTCEDCKGYGTKNKESIIICKNCDGTGEIKYTTKTPFGIFVQNALCDKCNGTGHIIKEKCKKCIGKGIYTEEKELEITIMAGVDNGNIIKLKKEGNDGEKGGPSGDLYIILNVDKHDFFERHGMDIYYKMPISLTKAILGGEIEVPILTGTQTFDINPGTQNLDRFYLKGKGVKDIHSEKYGDIIFDVLVIIPEKINKKQIELMKKFEEEFKSKNNKSNNNIFDKIKEMFSNE